MKTRSGNCYFRPESAAAPPLTKRGCGESEIPVASHRKKARVSLPAEQGDNFFDWLPDDLVLLILSKLSSSASEPSDLINVILTCQRLNILGTHRMVLSKVSKNGIYLKAKCWSEWAHRFLKQCTKAGNLEACYTLGMIYFYCLNNRRNGISLLAKAAIASHPEAFYSLSVIQFNGSGGTKHNKDLRAGFKLCSHAAHYGHIDALRELGHCLQDGYGVAQNVAEGRRLLLQANARELAAVLGNGMVEFSPNSLLSDFGCNVPTPEGHPANRFMVEWFTARDGSVIRGEGVEGLRMCSYGGCGRPETRKLEFRRCSVCQAVSYCSRACQALHWKLGHKAECSAMDRWVEQAAGGGDAQETEENRGRQVI